MKQEDMKEQYRAACVHFGFAFGGEEHPMPPETVNIVVDITQGPPDNGLVYVFAARDNILGFRQIKMKNDFTKIAKREPGIRQEQKMLYQRYKMNQRELR